MAAAESLNGLGLIARNRGDLAKAEDYLDQALKISETLAPDSISRAQTFFYLGTVARRRGDLAQAEEFFHQTLAIQEKLSPNGLGTASALLNLGIVAQERGDLTKAEIYVTRALQIQEKLSPDSLEVAASLNSLGIVASLRRDLAKANEYFAQALTIKEKLAPGGLDIARTFLNLGSVAYERDDMARAEEYYSRALAIDEKVAPNGLEMAGSLLNLGVVDQSRGDLPKAEEYLSQALAIYTRLAPDSMEMAETLGNLGDLNRHNSAKAEESYNRALAIREKLAPGSRDVAVSFTELGDLARERGDLAKAEGYYNQARSILEKQTPGSKEYAEVLADLAEIKLGKLQLDASEQFFDQALAALESQTAQLGGSQDVRSNFRAKYLHYYQDYIDLLIQQKKTELAFQVLERSRARGLLEMLSEAHIDLRKGVDGALFERERSLQADISGKYDRRIRLLSNKHTDEQIATVNQEIEKLVAEYKDIEEQIQASSPSYAALTQPQPLNAKEAQQLLDQDTLLLAYSLGQEHSYVFALTADTLEAHPLPKGADINALAQRAYKEELSINNPAAGYHSADVLSRMLLEPVAKHLSKKRLAIMADGALQYIPFAALRAHQGLPLIADHEIVDLHSVSTLAVLRKETQMRKPAPKMVAVLADPVFDANDERLKAVMSPQKEGNSAVAGRALERQVTFEESDPAQLLTRSTADMGMIAEGAPLYLPRLLSTRHEAESVLATIPAGQGMAALDFDASRATALSPDIAQYRIVHFATHALLNSTHPELSGLVLSLVDKHGNPENGFLDLEDVYNLNLSADLVVLSACETGFGQEIRGEGLVGLTRAFMYAGAPRVVASLWRVPDHATAELMRYFYEGMQIQGLPPAAALRQAQLNLSHEKRWAAPYYWAGFTLQGEWK